MRAMGAGRSVDLSPLRRTATTPGSLERLSIAGVGLDSFMPLAMVIRYVGLPLPVAAVSAGTVRAHAALRFGGDLLPGSRYGHERDPDRAGDRRSPSRSSSEPSPASRLALRPLRLAEEAPRRPRRPRRGGDDRDRGRANAQEPTPTRGHHPGLVRRSHGGWGPCRGPLPLRPRSDPQRSRASRGEGRGGQHRRGDRAQGDGAMNTDGDIPIRVRQEVRRILDAEARRLLAEQLDRDSFTPAALADRDRLHRGANKPALSLKAKPIPIRHRHGKRRAGVA